jgi:hypothetical protein
LLLDVLKPCQNQVSKNCDKESGSNFKNCEAL